MKDAKLHKAGQIINGVQKCTRCHTTLLTGETGWAPGATVRSRKGSGMKDVSREEGGSVRLCGRQK